MPSLNKYYKLGALLPLGCSIIFGLLLAVTHDGSRYKSEWSTDDGFGLTIVLTLLLSAFIAFLSSTIFLNKIAAIKTNLFFSFLSWIVAAGVVCVYVIYLEAQNFSWPSAKYGAYPGSRLLDGYVMSMAILHLLGLFATYFHFITTNKKSTNNNR